jgi:acid stress chaperone HdeB
MFRLQIVAITAALAMTFGAHTAKAEAIDLSEFTCGQFTQAGQSATKDDAKGLAAILFWVAGYHASDTNGTIVDFAHLQAEFEDVAKHCADHPKVKMLKAASDNMGGEEPGKDAVDLATITCEKVNKTTEDKAEGLATILMWLAGYQAGFAGDTIFDADAFGEQVDQIAEYCAANPQIGLYAASEKFMLPAAE